MFLQRNRTSRSILNPYLQGAGHQLCSFGSPVIQYAALTGLPVGDFLGYFSVPSNSGKVGCLYPGHISSSSCPAQGYVEPSLVYYQYKSEVPNSSPQGPPPS
ncbi:hypothetical protein FKM82_015093 [Ascaphus truei]